MRVRTRPGSRTIGGSYRAGTVSKVVNVSEDVPFPATAVRRNFSRTIDLTEVCVDAVTPGYFRSRREGSVLPVNQFSSTKPFITGGGMRCDLRLGYDIVNGQMATKRRGTWVLDPILGELPFNEPRATFDFDRMLQQSLANMRSELWDVGTFIAEAGKTASMVGGAVNSTRQRAMRIISHMRKLRRGRKASLSQLMDEFASLWMEARFGWRILYYDILSAQEAYQRFREKEDVLYKRYTVTEDSHEDWEEPWTPIRNGGSFTPWDTRWVSSRTSVGRAGCMGHIDLSSPVSVDPIITAWEVIPYTMVVDWFFNVGDALQAWSPLAAGKLDTSFISQEDTFTHILEVRVRPDYKFQGRPWQQCDTVESNTHTDGTTVVNTYKTRDPRSPTFNLSFRPNLGNLRWLDGIALAWLTKGKLRELALLASSTKI